MDTPSAAAHSVAGPAAVDIWLLPLSDKGPTDAERADCIGLMDAEECARAARFALPAARDQYLQARALVRLVLGRHAGVAPRALRFAATRWGRPLVVGPDAARALRFSLSHTAGLMALAVSEQLEIGVDVEDSARSVDIEALGQSFFAPPERQRLLAAPAGAARRALGFELWTLKEAYAKAQGRGLAHGLGHFAVEPGPPGEPRLLHDLGTPPLPAAPSRWLMRLWRPTQAHVLALAALLPAGTPPAAAPHPDPALALHRLQGWADPRLPSRA